MQTNKRSRPENSQTSTNIADSKRRKKEMDENRWQQWDERFLTMLGDVRHNVDTTMGKRYSTEFYRTFARRLSEASGIPFSALDCGLRIRRLRDIFQSYSEDISTHTVMTPDRFQFLLRRCFYQEVRPVQVPRSLSTNPNGVRRSTRGGGGSSGGGCSGGGCSDGGCSGGSRGSRDSGSSLRSVGQRSANTQSLSAVLAHLRINYRERVDANRLFYFNRLLDANPSFIPLFMDLATHEERVRYLEDLDLDPYVPRTQN